MFQIPEWLRSVLITFVTALALLILGPEFDWSQSAIIAAVIAAARTAISALLPGGSFGYNPSTSEEG